MPAEMVRRRLREDSYYQRKETPPVDVDVAHELHRARARHRSSRDRIAHEARFTVRHVVSLAEQIHAPGAARAPLVFPLCAAETIAVETMSVAAQFELVSLPAYIQVRSLTPGSRGAP